MENEKQKRWNNKQVAEIYDKFAQRFSMYKNTSRDLVDIAEIKEGMNVVDLACGTGVATEAILKKTGTTGKIYDVDFSQAMLDIAKEKIKAGNVDFIQSPAEKIDEVIKGKVDRVVCNSAFWQLPTIKTLKAIRNILKDDGMLVFNLGQSHSSIGEAIEKPTFRYLVAEIAVKEYDFSLDFVPDFNAFERILDKESFIIALQKTIEYQDTAEEIYEFYKIPLMIGKFLPELNYEQRMQILDKAYGEFDKTRTYPNKWLYFVVKKNT